MFKVEDRDIRYVIFLEHAQPELVTKQLVRDHVAHLEKLEEDGLLELCGPFPEDAGGMVVLRVADANQAREIAESDPFIASGAETYELRRWELSHRGNQHLGVIERTK